MLLLTPLYRKKKTRTREDMCYVQDHHLVDGRAVQSSDLKSHAFRIWRKFMHINTANEAKLC